MPSTCMYCRESEAVGQGLNCHLHPDKFAALQAELVAAREELKAHKLSHPLSCEGIDSLLDQLKETQQQRDSALAQGKREALKSLKDFLFDDHHWVEKEVWHQEHCNGASFVCANCTSQHIAAELQKLDTGDAGKER